MGQNFGEGQYFDNKRATVYCLGHRLSKHKTRRYAINLRGNHDPLATSMVHPHQEKHFWPSPGKVDYCAPPWRSIMHTCIDGDPEHHGDGNEEGVGEGDAEVYQEVEHCNDGKDCKLWRDTSPT